MADVWRTDRPSSFFAEDIFGHQFAIAGEKIVTFDLETGEQEGFADNLEAFATELFGEPSLHTGWPLAHEWQEKYSALPLGMRLVPRRPFVLGGDYVLENLIPVPETEGLRARTTCSSTEEPSCRILRHV